MSFKAWDHRSQGVFVRRGLPAGTKDRYFGVTCATQTTIRVPFVVIQWVWEQLSLELRLESLLRCYLVK